MGLNSKIKSLIFAGCSVATMGGLAAFASSRQNEKVCEKVSINIDNEYNNYFIGDKEVRDLLTRGGERKLEGLPNQHIDLKNLEKRISRRPPRWPWRPAAPSVSAPVGQSARRL